MVFRPFKPLTIRKPPDASQPSSTAEVDDPHAPVAKKPRLQADDGQTSCHITSNSDQKADVLQRNRKTLLQVENPSIGISKRLDNEGDRVHATGDDRFFNVLWRKPTAKKHKTWDGDGIVSVRAGYAYLQDVSGLYIGRAAVDSDLDTGINLSIGGKEIEICSEITSQEYLSGRRFLDVKDDSRSSISLKRDSGSTKLEKQASYDGAELTTIIPDRKTPKHDAAATAKAVAPKTDPKIGAYKKPFLETTQVPRGPTNEAIPRYDPNAPGALVMKRPLSVPKGKQIVDVVVDPLLGKHLRQHQREGVQFLYECVMGMRSYNGEGAILADDMGLGKTLQTITLLWTLLKQNPIYNDPPVIKKALIVCPVTLINNWRKEFRKWLGNGRIGVFVFDDKRKRLTDFVMGKAYSVMIVGYEKLRSVQDGLARSRSIDIVIADEGHRLKTLQNKSGQAIQSLNATKRIILSGTPIQNDLREFFAAVDLVNPGVLGTFKSFVREFEGPIVRSRQPESTKKDIEKGEARSEELRSLTSMFILRRMADILAKYLPPKTEYVLFCDPTPTQANIYRQVLVSPVFQSIVRNSESALQLITILKKLCNSPSLLSATRHEDTPNDLTSSVLSSLPPQLLRHFSPSSSGKIRVLDELLHNLRTSTSEKIVLVSNYTSTLNLLATLLTSLSLPFLRLDGTTPAPKRQPLVDDFNRMPADACFAFLLSAKAGGTGLNLIGASRLVLFDVDWNPATDIQAMARIHRDGQKRHCRIYRVILKGSLEEKIWQRQVTKIGLADSVMEHKDTVAQFSRDELRDLFRLDESSKCQTHELLHCDCAGRGKRRPPDQEMSTASPDNKFPGLSTADESEAEVSECSDDASIEEDLPDLPILMKASQVNMEEQERRIKKDGLGTSKMKNKTQEAKMKQSLAQYAHIDPSLLFFPEIGKSVAREIDDDDVLLPLLKEDDCRVSFIFKKTSQTQAASVPTTTETAMI